MRVEVLLFGPLADAAGRDSLSVNTDATQPTARDVLDALTQAQPAMRSMLTACRLAVNHAFADDATLIRAGDEVAVIGLVSGG
ncbi:MAG: MoaD/ThiS family protein [Planctomycetota bacterium]|nr:MAG: MoaD/ThiS family protein [Planctomycetota bacterium]